MNNQTMLRDSGMKMKTRVKAGATERGRLTNVVTRSAGAVRGFASADPDSGDAYDHIRTGEEPGPGSHPSTTARPGCRWKANRFARRSCIFRPSGSRNKLFGPEHPEVAVTLGNLGLFHKALGRLAESQAASRSES